MIKNIFKDYFKRKDNLYNEFSIPEIIDRNIEKINICHICNTLYGKDFENIEIQPAILNGEKLTKVICKKCDNNIFYRNWNK